MKRESEDEQGVRRRQIPMSTSSPDETSYSIVGKGRSVSTSSLGTLRGRFCNSYSTRKRFFFFFFCSACSAHSPLCCAARHAHDTTADGDADNGLLSPRKLKNKRKRHHSMLKLWPHEPEPFLEETGSPFSFLYKSHVRTPQSVARALSDSQPHAAHPHRACTDDHRSRHHRTIYSYAPLPLLLLLSASPLMLCCAIRSLLLTSYVCSLPLVLARSLPRSPGRNQSVRSLAVHSSHVAGLTTPICGSWRCCCVVAWPS